MHQLEISWVPETVNYKITTLNLISYGTGRRSKHWKLQVNTSRHPRHTNRLPILLAAKRRKNSYNCKHPLPRISLPVLRQANKTFFPCCRQFHLYGGQLLLLLPRKQWSSFTTVKTRIQTLKRQSIHKLNLPASYNLKRIVYRYSTVYLNIGKRFWLVNHFFNYN